MTMLLSWNCAPLASSSEVAGCANANFNSLHPRSPPRRAREGTISQPRQPFPAVPSDRPAPFHRHGPLGGPDPKRLPLVGRFIEPVGVVLDAAMGPATDRRIRKKLRNVSK
jgi:hypothetical protein